MSLLPASLTSSLDDVVFEGRNRAYGAYQLRQDYKQHLASAGGITALLCVLLLLGWAAWQQVAATTVSPPIALHPVEAKPTIYVVEPPKPAALATPKMARPAATHMAATMATKVVKDATPLPTPAPNLPPQDFVDGSVGPPTLSVADGSATGPVAATAGDSDVATTAPAVTGPFIVVEKMPEFAGGQAALLRYLQKNLRYPAKALAAQAEGRVFLSFVVQADGSIADVTLLKGLGYGLDEEAQRVVRQMPAWIPGFQSKRAVPVRFTLPITFKVQ